MVRGALVTIIYRKTTEISIAALDNSAAVTLMSTDVERIISGFRSLHEVWANVFQIGFSVWILEQQIGAACVGPVAVCLGISH
jgi:ATP-binding cassette subfamily C (CFTR/MRP) protein 1